MDTGARTTRHAGRAVAAPVTCPYCGELAALLPSSTPLYAGRDFGPAYARLPCGAWMGCHRGTRRPLGRLADAALRRAKRAAHDAFDPLQRRDGMTRRVAYAWLARRLGLPAHLAHVGLFDLGQCRLVMALCRREPRRQPASGPINPKPPEEP